MADSLLFNVSILGAFTNMNVYYQINDQSLTDNVSVSNGLATFYMQTWTAQLLASLDYKFLTLYGSIGYNSGTASFDLVGDYTLTYDIEENGMVITTLNETIESDIDLCFDAKGMHTTVGV